MRDTDHSTTDLRSRQRRGGSIHVYVVGIFNLKKSRRSKRGEGGRDLNKSAAPKDLSLDREMATRSYEEEDMMADRPL